MFSDTCEKINEITKKRLADTLRSSLETLLKGTLSSSVKEEKKDEENVPELCRALCGLARRASEKQRQIEKCMERESKLEQELMLERERSAKMEEKIQMMSDLLARAKIEGILPSNFDVKRLLDLRRRKVVTQTMSTQTLKHVMRSMNTQTTEMRNDCANLEERKHGKIS